LHWLISRSVEPHIVRPLAALALCDPQAGEHDGETSEDLPTSALLPIFTRHDHQRRDEGERHQQ
jgi:hypothetical protein